MAHQLNVNQSTYAKMENSSTKITIDKLFSVAKLLETDVSEILDLKIRQFLIKQIMKLLMLLAK